jgi:hypothetical protein
MNAERVLAHYERIADAPDAIVRLRRFILDLAVRGMLVPQDPKDEPASELLTRIAKEKARLVKAGEIGKRNELPVLKEDEVPFPVPSAWLWLRLGELGFTQTGTTPSKNQADHFGKHIPFIKECDNLGIVKGIMPTIWPGEERPYQFPLLSKDVQIIRNVKARTSDAFIYGRIEYDDIFKNRQASKFCYQFMSDEGYEGVVGCGNETVWDDQ